MKQQLHQRRHARVRVAEVQSHLRVDKDNDNNITTMLTWCGVDSVPVSQVSPQLNTVTRNSGDQNRR